MQTADTLVLPSDYDGWGAVISEALIEGTRVIASDGCGARAVAALAGDVFATGDSHALADLIDRSITRGRVSLDERAARKEWAQRLNADAGADYLMALIESADAPPPWMQNQPDAEMVS